MLKDEEIYNIFDTTAILNRPATVAVDSHSGLAGVAHWMNGYFRLKGENTIPKDDPLVQAVRAQVDELYAQGRNTVMGDEELEQMVIDARFECTGPNGLTTTEYAATLTKMLRLIRSIDEVNES